MFAIPPETASIEYEKLTPLQKIVHDLRTPDPEIHYTGLDLLAPAPAAAMMQRHEATRRKIELQTQQVGTRQADQRDSRLKGLISASTVTSMASAGLNAANQLSGLTQAMSVMQALAIPLSVIGPLGSLMSLAAWLAQMEISRGALNLLNGPGGLLTLQTRFDRDRSSRENFWLSQGVELLYLNDFAEVTNFTVQQYSRKTQEGTAGNPLNLLYMPMDIVSGAMKRFHGTKGEARKLKAEKIREWAIWEIHAWKLWAQHHSGVPRAGCPTYFLILLSVLMGTNKPLAPGQIDPPKPTQLLAMPENEAVSVIAELLKRKGSIDFV